MKFIDIQKINETGGNGPDKDDAFRLLSSAAGFVAAKKNGVVSSDKTTLRIGGSWTWNGYDLFLLDMIVRLGSIESDIVCEVFDLDHVATNVELEQYIPNAKPMQAWPIVGVWDRGNYLGHYSGLKGRNYVLELYGSNQEEYLTQFQRAK